MGEESEFPILVFYEDVAQNGQSGSKRRLLFGKESEIWSSIFAEELKMIGILSKESRLVCQLKHNVGSNPIILTNALIVQRKEYEFPKLEM